MLQWSWRWKVVLGAGLLAWLTSGAWAVNLGFVTVGNPGNAGELSGAGAGMNVMPSAGYNFMPGALLQVGTAHLNWDPWRYSSTLHRWVGVHTWGVGLADRKDVLLLDTGGEYELNYGAIDTTNLPAGHYVLKLVPSEAVTVLRDDVDLGVSQPGGIVTYAGSVSEPVSIEFDVVTP